MGPSARAGGRAVPGTIRGERRSGGGAGRARSYRIRKYRGCANSVKSVTRRSGGSGGLHRVSSVVSLKASHGGAEKRGGARRSSPLLRQFSAPPRDAVQDARASTISSDPVSDGGPRIPVCGGRLVPAPPPLVLRLRLSSPARILHLPFHHTIQDAGNRTARAWGHRGWTNSQLALYWVRRVNFVPCTAPNGRISGGPSPCPPPRRGRLAVPARLIDR